MLLVSGSAQTATARCPACERLRSDLAVTGGWVPYHMDLRCECGAEWRLYLDERKPCVVLKADLPPLPIAPPSPPPVDAVDWRGIADDLARVCRRTIERLMGHDRPHRDGSGPECGIEFPLTVNDMEVVLARYDAAAKERP